MIIGFTFLGPIFLVFLMCVWNVVSHLSRHMHLIIYILLPTTSAGCYEIYRSLPNLFRRRKGSGSLPELRVVDRCDPPLQVKAGPV